MERGYETDENDMTMYRLTRFANILIVSLTMMLAACGDDDDYRPAPDPDPVNPVVENVTQLLTHKAGTAGVPIVIMADGYTAKDIASGEYRKAVNAAVDALFSSEPMASLKDLFDVYEVALESEYRGIDLKKHNTALSTHLVSDASVEVYGDSIEVQKQVRNALAKMEGAAAANAKFNKVTTIVLLNSSAYAGVTLMARDETVKDGIPQGFALSYIPANATSKGRNVFKGLVQHEAVGHGLAKLADEYYYATTPTKEQLAEYETASKCGFFQNVHYHQNASDTKTQYYITHTDGTKEFIYLHTMEPGTLAGRFAADAAYAGENLKWYRGANTYNSYFYRPTMNFIAEGYTFVSMMDNIVHGYELRFNVLSRLAIYKCVMRNAYGVSWKFDDSSEADYNNFVNFDKLKGGAATASKALRAAQGGELTRDADVPTLPSPKFINIE